MKYVTTIYKQHFHIVEIDEFGKGLTVSTKGNNITDHKHKVLDWTIYASFENHLHEIEVFK